LLSSTGRTVDARPPWKIFDVFSAVGLTIRQAKHAFFQDRILAVPQGHAEAQQLLMIADAGKIVLSPVIGAGACLVMREVVLGIPILAVVLANRTPFGAR
jgi:hypothetical protein